MRFLDLTSGTAMIVSDLHGDRDAFDRILGRFDTLRTHGDAQRLILLGDIIHGYGPPDRDHSLGMILDVIRLRDEWGPDTLVMLLGNHEMPHIYGITLAKGDYEFTPRFEHSLGEHRERVIEFLEGLPFYIRTAAGVMLSHAGPAMESIQQVDELRTFDHNVLLDEADLILGQADDPDDLYSQFRTIYGVPYDEMAYRYLAIEGPQSPRYPHLLRGFMIARQSQRFQALWNALFTQNEYGLTEQSYLKLCLTFLEAFSAGAPAPQHVMVSGHIATPRGGHHILNTTHLRLASAAHARPRDAGEYLLLDCAKPVQTAQDLLDHLHPVFG